MKRFITLIVISLITVPCVFSMPLEDLVSAAHAQQLRASNDFIIRTQTRGFTPALWPNKSDLRQTVNGAIAGLNSSIMVEILYLYKKPAQLHTSAASWDEKQRTQVFNQVPSISTMTGLHYYSETRDALRLFYDYATVIDGPVTKKPIADPVFPQPPKELTLYARQKDLTFGDNIYRYDYLTTNDAIYFIQENITSMTIGIFPVIGKGNLRSIVAIIDCGDSILIYALSTARMISVPGISNQVSASFSNRAEALLKWFSGRLDSEFTVN